MHHDSSAERVETLVIGAGQAGLATSYHLTRQGREHLVLEQGSVAETWRTKRWDSFTLATPNWMLRLPGFEYVGDDPDGFLSRDEVTSYLRDYATSFNAPVCSGVRVESVEYDGPTIGGRYLVRSANSCFTSDNVVVASGGFFTPRIPDFARQLPKHILQLTPDTYRNPAALPGGAVLIVGSGQSGAQIAEELLYESDHRVYLAVGRAGRIPRRYRGHDATWWMLQIARVKGLQTVDDLPSPAAKFAANAHVSGKGGGHDINLRHLRRDGAIVLGHMRGVDHQKLLFAPDAEDGLSRADDTAARFQQSVDEFVDMMGWEVPPEVPHPESPEHGGEQPPIEQLDLRSADIATVIWATGYRPDFSWVELPVFDADGYPVQRRGVTNYPGLYFVGLPWLHTAASGLLVGVGDDAAHVVHNLSWLNS